MYLTRILASLALIGNFAFASYGFFVQQSMSLGIFFIVVFFHVFTVAIFTPKGE
jgi:membrane protein YdbS with pleckstrin-like domain